MLRKIRIALAVLFFSAVTLLFLDFTGTAAEWFGWTAKIQFLPSLLAANFAVVAGLVFLTLLFGRIYCSVICPLGVLQDVFSHAAGRRKRNRFAYAPAMTLVRAGFLAAFIALAALGLLSVASLVAPYSAYGRIASNFLAPVWALGNNALAALSEAAGGYAFYPAEIWFKGAGVFLAAAATLAVVGVLAWKGGRTYCNTVCPVGTVLGFFAKYSLFKPVIDASKCNSCSLCSRNCKSKCIDYKNHSIDYSRCVACFDCVGVCRKSAISYSPAFAKKAAAKHAEAERAARPEGARAEFSAAKKEPPAVFRKGRRGFFSTLFMLAGGAAADAAETMKVDGGLAPIRARRRPERAFKISPPGSGGIANIADKCTACQLCVSACPSRVLVPSRSLSGFMQPEMTYENGYCRIECVECSKVCPAGAILPISPEEKASTQIGRAVWTASRCIVNADGMQCDNCFRQCPTGAIQMVAKDPKDPKSLKIPTVDVARCIGCGACENLCPARPVAAICVEGNPSHNRI